MYSHVHCKSSIATGQTSNYTPAASGADASSKGRSHDSELTVGAACKDGYKRRYHRKLTVRTVSASMYCTALVPRPRRPRGGGRQPCRGVCPPASIPLLLYRTVTIKVGLTLYRGLDQRGSMFTEIIQGRRTQQCRLGTGQPSLPHGLYIAAPIMCSPQ